MRRDGVPAGPLLLIWQRPRFRVQLAAASWSAQGGGGALSRFFFQDSYQAWAAALSWAACFNPRPAGKPGAAGLLILIPPEAGSILLVGKDFSRPIPNGGKGSDSVASRAGQAVAAASFLSRRLNRRMNGAGAGGGVSCSWGRLSATNK